MAVNMLVRSVAVTRVPRRLHQQSSENMLQHFDMTETDDVRIHSGLLPRLSKFLMELEQGKAAKVHGRRCSQYGIMIRNMFNSAGFK